PTTRFEGGAESRGDDGTGNKEVLRGGSASRDRRRCAAIVGRPRGRGTQSRARGGTDRRNQTERRRIGATKAPVRAPGDSARARGIDGRIGFDLGAVVRGGLRDAQQLGDVSRGSGGERRRR